ncbi:MAG: bifunctional D-glycero-beta-D-manno-heptose-7-phosphate kinase/D-glycero-beta-D-manno-heptose 1-phosphate adenylyltransferase HldE [Methylovulum sp.]|uniref:bifunctional D-glycero-beta-D-manno-heptose-7-phosphate kinase/D-glycero-beta-D-manno-heptose 1-phosphate adenylyltransferase HldE n=1 Tax=Methylovulum sp. TaxID=1916980 RepID=UPI00262C30FD|nr:bifunctional D-glycero-beta-D-manno-heptose-7-phosphate kinase/D-glycero-beta-D-manno-heptose 1-phosphate adenylyltransferase HldE [Methylovulum sp.]MDD2725021.1 bifunctional D-glycero-beta-D-manno-heptose-7-phosphate kinase/D-glycero-beta-D-manno-heptose 1-phosphate adenylyltransferase HldE [Methylovulum sp.]MDD5125414.1 bifunctional D-glycero-beta-D-manno-heptose-7-phosphate kinase/D-glycero-beta-D-manno-heptose 1-phosphate adenylyltransferase HldE [Methylovulum sp.]
MLATLPDFTQAKIIVIGDVMLDRYWSGQASRISPEAPVPVVRVNNHEDRVGGAANVALNIARLGGRVTLLGVVGDDAEGDILKHMLEAEGVHCAFVFQPSIRTICKLRIMAQHQQLIRVDFEQVPLQFDFAALQSLLQEQLLDHDVLVLSDYGKGTLTDVAACIRSAKQVGLNVLVDPKGTDFHRYANADVITPNLAELQAVVGACADELALQAKGRKLIADQQIAALLLTRGEAGMTLVLPESSHSLPARAKDVFDVTGAGDTVIAVMSLGMAVKLPLQEAMYLANLAGGIVVGKLGTSTVSHEELTRALHGDRDAAVYGIVSEDELACLISHAQAGGERVIMTNGCFDLLHAGHVTYLQQARALGDRLIVAVNSDASVKILKGETRPINGLQQRMTVLAALACVDWVVAFEEETPERLYCKLLPDVIVKGGDYTQGQVAGGDCVIKAGGEVKILSFVEGQSTTHMINKARGEE